MIIRRPSPFCLLSTGHGTLIVNRNDYRLTGAGSGFGVGYQLMTTGWFDPEEAATLAALFGLRCKHFGPGAVALDAGANVGTMTLELAKASYGWGTVIAIEAQERLFYALAGNLAINNAFNASAIHAAVGNEDGEMQIPHVDYTVPASFGSLELRQRPGTEDIGQPVDYAQLDTVPLMRIDSLGLGRLDVLKVDVEGMELEALTGATTTIENQHPVLLVEHIKVDEAALRATLRAWGYVATPMGINTLAIHESDPCLTEAAVYGA